MRKGSESLGQERERKTERERKAGTRATRRSFHEASRVRVEAVERVKGDRGPARVRNANKPSIVFECDIMSVARSFSCGRIKKKILARSSDFFIFVYLFLLLLLLPFLLSFIYSFTSFKKKREMRCLPRIVPLTWVSPAGLI